MRKYKVEDLYATIITDGYYAKDYKILSTIEPRFSIVKYSGWRKCLVFDTSERLRVYSRYNMKIIILSHLNFLKKKMVCLKKIMILFLMNFFLK